MAYNSSHVRSVIDARKPEIRPAVRQTWRLNWSLWVAGLLVLMIALPTMAAD